MVAYATPEDIRAAVARDPAKPTGTAASLAPVDLQAAVTNAQAEVDARLRGRYTLPFTEPVPALVKAITVDIAAYLATLSYRQSKDLSPTDPIALRYDRAQKLLDRIADGSADLDAGDGGPATSGGGGIGTPVNPYDGSLVAMEDFGLSTGWRC